MPAPPRHLTFTLPRSSTWRPAPSHSQSQSESQTIVRRCSCSAICSPSSRCVRRVQHRQPPHRPCVPIPHRSLAQVRSDVPPDIFFVPASSMLMSPSAPRAQVDKPGGQRDYEPPNERIVKLGKSEFPHSKTLLNTFESVSLNRVLTLELYIALRILSAHLPTLLVNPLPQEILSPNISLHLFPSTHPHLPAVKGKVAYRAAIWTAPVAWGCMPSMPIVGNVKLRILSERMVRAGSVTDFDNEHTYGPEKLVVRWITEENMKDKLGEHTERKDSNDSGDKTAPGRSTTTRPDGGSGESYAGASSASNGTNKRLSALLGGEAPIFKLG